MAFKKLFVVFLRIGISVVLLFFLFRGVDTKALFGLIKNADKLYLFFAFVSFFVIDLLCLLRWDMLLKAADIHLPLKRVIISFCGGIFFNLFLPSTIGGDLVRSIDLASHTKKTKEVVATVILDRLSGYVGLVLISLLAVLSGFRFVRDSSVIISILIITAALVSILLLLFNKFIYSKINRVLRSIRAGRIIESVKGVHQELHYFRKQKKAIFNNLALSFIIQAIFPLMVYFTGLALGIKIKIVYFFVFLPIISAITLLPISLGGLGVRDAMTVYFFAKAGVAKDPAFAMSLVNFSFILLYGSIGGIIYVLTLHHRRIQHRKAPPVPGS